MQRELERRAHGVDVRRSSSTARVRGPEGLVEAVPPASTSTRPRAHTPGPVLESREACDVGFGSFESVLVSIAAVHAAWHDASRVSGECVLLRIRVTADGDG